MPNKVKAYELQSKYVCNFCASYAIVLKAGFSLARTKNDLEKQLAELKKELLTLRVQKIAGGATSKLTKMYVYTSRFMGHWNLGLIGMQ
jgi:large subunit ribosomal protein L35e